MTTTTGTTPNVPMPAGAVEVDDWRDVGTGAITERETVKML
jgi:hypothetical protein